MAVFRETFFEKLFGPFIQDGIWVQLAFGFLHMVPDGVYLRQIGHLGNVAQRREATLGNVELPRL